MQLGVSAFPTFHFYVNGKKVDEMKGANPRGIEDKVIQHQVVGVNSFGGKAFTLGGGSTPAWDGSHFICIYIYINIFSNLFSSNI